jgi:hypothetical protein
MPDQPCAGCRGVITDDPSGLCEDCQTDVVSERPGSLTEDQRMAIIGGLMQQCVLFNRTERAELIARAIPGWTWRGDLGGLSQRQAGDLLEYLAELERAHAS